METTIWSWAKRQFARAKSSGVDGTLRDHLLWLAREAG